MVAIQTGARLRRFVEEEEVLEEVFAAARRAPGSTELHDHVSILEWLNGIASHQIGLQGNARGMRRRTGLRLTVSVEAAHTESGDLHARRSAQREELEHLIDSSVEQLEPDEYREVVLLRDYCGGDWEFIRERMELLSIEAAQELYRRALGQLQRRMRPHLRRRE
jgi:hypothetical protein